MYISVIVSVTGIVDPNAAVVEGQKIEEIGARKVVVVLRVVRLVPEDRAELAEVHLEPVGADRKHVRCRTLARRAGTRWCGARWPGCPARSPWPGRIADRNEARSADAPAETSGAVIDDERGLLNAEDVAARVIGAQQIHSIRRPVAIRTGNSLRTPRTTSSPRADSQRPRAPVDSRSPPAVTTAMRSGSGCDGAEPERRGNHRCRQKRTTPQRPRTLDHDKLPGPLLAGPLDVPIAGRPTPEHTQCDLRSGSRVPEKLLNDVLARSQGGEDYAACLRVSAGRSSWPASIGRAYLSGTTRVPPSGIGCEPVETGWFSSQKHQENAIETASPNPTNAGATANTQVMAIANSRIAATAGGAASVLTHRAPSMSGEGLNPGVLRPPIEHRNGGLKTGSRSS